MAKPDPTDSVRPALADCQLRLNALSWIQEMWDLLHKAGTAPYLMRKFSQALTELEAQVAHEPNTKLMELADKIDHEQLWRWAGMAHDKMTAEQKDRMLAGVQLRRYADLLGNDGWRIYPPHPGISFRAGTLDEAVERAKRNEYRRAES